MRLTLFLSVFGMVLSSCCKEPSTLSKVETPEFRWKIDSVDYQPCEPNYGGAFEPYYVTSSYISGNRLQLNLGFNYPDSMANCFPQLVLKLPLYDTGVFGFDNNYNIHLGGGVDSNFNRKPSYYVNLADSLSYVDLSRNIEINNNWITGTFQFKAFNENDSNDSIIITEGYFNHNLTY